VVVRNLPRVACLYQIGCKYLHPYTEILAFYEIFNMAAVRHLGFIDGSRGTTVVVHCHDRRSNVKVSS